MSISQRPAILNERRGCFILANGLNLERWFARFYQHLSGVPEVVVSTGVKPMGITEGPYNGKPNPHARMSAENALIYVDNIRDAP